MATYNGYYTSFDENKRGSLERGKIAAMVILSKNPFEIDKTELNTIKVEQLLLKGQPYKEVQMNPMKHILKRIMKKGSRNL